MKRLILILILFIGYSFANAQQHPYIAFKGIWEGQLQLGPSQLKLVMVVKENGDSVHVEFDSPDQYSTGIQADQFSMDGRKMHAEVSSLNMVIDGELSDATTINCKFTQRMGSIPLILKKTDYRKQYLRPQTPVPPYPYKEEFISFDASRLLNNDNAKVNGTLTLPNTTPKATIILLSGSGWQDRDETIFNHRPFKVIADHLTRVGYAVYRYDDLSPKVYEQSTTLDFANVAELVMTELLKREDLKEIPIGYIGHSEGSLVAAIVASRNSNVNFFISLAGMGERLSDILLYQSLCVIDSTVPQKTVDCYVDFNKGMYKILEKESDIKKASTKFMNYVDKFTQNMTTEEIAATHLTRQEQFALSKQIFNPWMMQLFKLDPTTYFSKIKCPILALNGEKDQQVECGPNLQAIEKATRKNKNVTCKAIPKQNHLFQECETGSFNEYGEIAQTIHPTTLQTISYWLNCLFLKEN